MTRNIENTKNTKTKTKCNRRKIYQFKYFKTELETFSSYSGKPARKAFKYKYGSRQGEKNYTEAATETKI